jgi:hemoglobin
MSNGKIEYGVGDASYKAAGELEGITKLVNAFYDFMDSLPEAEVIRKMHSDSLDESRLRLAYFLSGWLGGPKLYSQNFGPIKIPQFHKDMPIGRSEVEAWMECMQKAVDIQPYAQDFKMYLMKQLRVPAERILVACEENQ